MQSLTKVQVKRIAKFLTASCAHIPQDPSSPKLGQWLDIISRATGFRDWNAMSRSIDEVPTLSKAEASWPGGGRYSFYGVARVLVKGEQPTHHFTQTIPEYSLEPQVVVDLVKSILLKAGHSIRHLVFRHSRPDVLLPNGQIAQHWKNDAEGCPVVVRSEDGSVSILLWWLREVYRTRDNIPDWAMDSTLNDVYFHEQDPYWARSDVDDELHNSLTQFFLQQLTGREQSRRTCLFLQHDAYTSEPTVPMLVEEGNPYASPADVKFEGNYAERLAAVAAYNSGLGLSTLDCSAISSRYDYAERARNEEDYTEFSGIYDD